MNESDKPVESVESSKKVAKVETHPEPPTSGGVLVLQWLTYAFWAWFGVAVSVLVGIVVNMMIRQNNVDLSGNAVAYPLAAVIILLIIAVVTDFFYSRHEPEKKVGGSNIIMLLHVVPFILIAIGALITIVFSLISMLLNSDPLASVDGPIQVMIVASVVAVVFGALAARTFFGKKRKVRSIAQIIMVTIAVVSVALAIAGPVAKTAMTKQDRLIEEALPSLADDIREYTRTRDELPGKLSDIKHNDSRRSRAVQKMIDDGLVEYKSNTEKPKDGSSYSPGEDPDTDEGIDIAYRPSRPVSQPKRFYYQLCTKYKYERKDQYSYSGYYESSSADSLAAGVAVDRYDYNYYGTPRVSSHPAGEVCYDLYADGKYGSIKDVF